MRLLTRIKKILAKSRRKKEKGGKKKPTQQEWDSIEKEFLTLLKERYFGEIYDTIKSFRTSQKSPYIKSHLCVLFVGIDTFSRFSRMFEEGVKENDLDKSIEQRFRKWLDTFVFTEKNTYYKKNKKKFPYDSAIVWRMRCSFLHFYSLPKPLKDGTRIVPYFGMAEADHQIIRKGMAAKGHKILYVDAYALTDAVFEGLILQLEGFKQMMKDDPDGYVEGVLMAHRIVTREGGSTVVFEKR